MQIDTGGILYFAKYSSLSTTLIYSLFARYILYKHRNMNDIVSMPALWEKEEVRMCKDYSSQLRRNHQANSHYFAIICILKSN